MDAALIDYQKQAAALDLVVTIYKATPEAKLQFAGDVFQQVLSGRSGYDAIAAVASQRYGINVEADVLRRYVELVRTPTPNAAIGAFLKRVQTEPALRQQVLSSTSSIDALQKVAAANGLTVSTADLQNYFAPWQLLVSSLRGLLQRKVINEQQFQQYAGFAPSDPSISGFGSGVDHDLLAAAISASGWATKATDLSSLSAPIATVVFPATAVIIGGFEGQRYTFHDLGDMLATSFSDTLDDMSQSVENLHDQVSSVFS